VFVRKSECEVGFKVPFAGGVIWRVEFRDGWMF